MTLTLFSRSREYGNANVGRMSSGRYKLLGAYLHPDPSPSAGSFPESLSHHTIFGPTVMSRRRPFVCLAAASSLQGRSLASRTAFRNSHLVQAQIHFLLHLTRSSVGRA